MAKAGRVVWGVMLSQARAAMSQLVSDRAARRATRHKPSPELPPVRPAAS
ncbi:hypothetical protein [Streptomyces sp. NBC_01092]|nr:hypothetical protein OG254_45195 [Streptomyces sp. NBC_01092]